ncbi:MAG TPA: DNRLRE domain-containing protein [bacterium]|nr:DNRLRE domain-containing protein [bacterium]
MKRLFLPAALLLVVLVMACTNEEPLPSGLDALHRANTDSLRVVTIPALEAAQYRLEVNPGLTSSLLVGRHDGITTRALIKFTGLSSVDTASVNAATLTLTQKGRWGSGGPFTCTIHKVIAGWAENTVRWSEIDGNYDPVALASFEVLAEDSASYEVQIPPAVINDWIAGADKNGLLLDFGDAGMAAELNSVDVSSAGYPALKLAFTTKAGEADTVTVNPAEDATLFTYDTIEPAEVVERGGDRLWIDNARGYRMLLRFDLSWLAPVVTIHQAYLSLPADSSLSLTGSADLGFRINSLTSDSSWQSPAAMAVDSSFSAPTGTASGSDGTIVLTTSTNIAYMSNMVQRWVTGTAANYGLVVQSTGYGSNLGKIAICNDPGAGGRVPTLRITYSYPAAVRF